MIINAGGTGCGLKGLSLFVSCGVWVIYPLCGVR